MTKADVPPDDDSTPNDPTVTDHPTGEKQAKKNLENEPPA
jgi:hypothetical protein